MVFIWPLVLILSLLCMMRSVRRMCAQKNTEVESRGQHTQQVVPGNGDPQVVEGQVVPAQILMTPYAQAMPLQAGFEEGRITVPTTQLPPADSSTALAITNYNPPVQLVEGFSIDESPTDQIRKLKELLDIDAITKEEFERKKTDLLAQI
jgi:hypothetical protein